MAEIEPNDIGLATFADVGDVANLQTNAKEIVAAINEVFACGGGSSAGEQLFMEGEDNAVIGGGNVILGSHNRVIGKGNIVIGDNNIVIGSDKVITESLGDISFEWMDMALKRIYFYMYSENVNLHLQAGD